MSNGRGQREKIGWRITSEERKHKKNIQEGEFIKEGKTETMQCED